MEVKIPRHFMYVTGICFVLFVLAVLSTVLVSKTKHPVLGIVSPLSDEKDPLIEQKQLAMAKQTTIASGNEYFPKNTEPRFTADYEINAKAYAVMERTSGELLLAKNLTQELPIASVTKIMTALITLEHGDLSKELTVSQHAAEIGEATMGLTAQEVVPVEDLLYGVMLPSGNDAAETLAEGLFQNRTNFIFMMNQKAESLGLFDTFYVNPTGLDEDTLEATTFSTALDQLVLANYALTNPRFAEIAATHYQEIPQVLGKHKAFYLYNILQLDQAYPGIKGIKPGITDFAGETLVSYAEREGKQIIVVLLGTQNSRDEVIKIYDWVFAQ